MCTLTCTFIRILNNNTPGYLLYGKILWKGRDLQSQTGKAEKGWEGKHKEKWSVDTEGSKLQPESRSPKLTQKLIMSRINLQLWSWHRKEGEGGGVWCVRASRKYENKVSTLLKKFQHTGKPSKTDLKTCQLEMMVLNTWAHGSSRQPYW